MAIMAVKVEDRSTLKMNEFFDYNGRCYGLSRSRTQTGTVGAELEDFYECTVLTDWVEDIPVVFLCEAARMGEAGPGDYHGGADREKEMPGGLYICGWYRQAKIYRRVFFPSLFLEGNICARSTDAVLLQEQDWISAKAILPEAGWNFKDKLYQVIENDEEGYEALAALVEADEPGAGAPDLRSAAAGRRVPIRYELAPLKVDKDAVRRAPLALQRSAKRRLSARESMEAQYDYCIGQCELYAQRLMSDACEDIGDIKTLREYGRMAATFGKNRPDGYYYKAMAEEQLGFIKEGLKTIQRALALEPDGADIIALKANLLADLGDYKQACELYSESYDISGDESYLLMKGRVLFMMGNVDGAYKVYREIRDKDLLSEAGINLKDMEHRWPFVAIRGLKSLLKKDG